MADDGLQARLLAGAQELGIALDAGQAGRLLRLVAELRDWNTRMNLTAITEPAGIVDKHLLDSLTLQPHLHGRRVADIGSGAGFPGLPLALVNPGREFTLVEATGKKLRFLEHAIEALGIDNAAAVGERAEAYRPPQPFDCVIARALGRIADFLRVAAHLCARDGRMLAMKGRHPAAELAGLPRGWRVNAVHELHVPGLEAARSVVVLERS